MQGDERYTFKLKNTINIDNQTVMKREWRRGELADQGERLLFLVIFGFFAVEFSRAFLREPNIITALYLFDQTIVDRKSVV